MHDFFCLIGLALLFASVAGGEPAQSIAVDLDLSQTKEVEVNALPGGVYEIRTTGGDPFILAQPLAAPVDADRQFVFSFEYFCEQGLPFFELFYGPPIQASHRATGDPVLSTEGWSQYALNLKDKALPDSWGPGLTQFRLDFGDQPGRVIQVRNLRLREPTPYERQQAAEREAKEQALRELEAALQRELATDHPVRFESVIAAADTLRLTGTVTGESRELWLCEAPFYQQPLTAQDFVWSQPLTVTDGRFAIELPRIRGTGATQHDRVYSSWLVARKRDGGWTPLSAQRFTDDLPAKWQLPEVKPKSKKGTTGLHPSHPFQFDDYRELGIHNCTKNIVLNSLIRPEGGPGRTPHWFNGRTYYAVDAAVSQLDAALQKMDQLDIVVSAIILIAKNTPMTHPDCAPEGIWAMPDVTTEAGWNYYAAGLDFLASRYSRPDRKYGRITHWIMHNEVDAGWVWTNAGAKPLHVYEDLCYRSLRTAYYTARRYNPAAKVFLSLTHHWTKPFNARGYAPKEMLELLAQRCRQEGDFEWALAYHPYPQNLRDPRTWLDRRPTFAFDTEYITPKNLEVLDAFMHLPAMRFRGDKLRTVIFSEQGPNSPDHSDESYRNQAAALVYMWLKFEKLETVESFILHRWMDAPPGGEGGLLLGLWTNLPDRTPRHSKKTAWTMYKLLGTERQQEAVDFAREVIGEKYWEEIPYRGAIR